MLAASLTSLVPGRRFERFASAVILFVALAVAFPINFVGLGLFSSAVYLFL